MPSNGFGNKFDRAKLLGVTVVAFKVLAKKFSKNTKACWGL